MKIFQYWDRNPPPPDVAGWIEGFRSGNAGLEHQLFDEERAFQFMLGHHGEQAAAAFASIAVPAFQADFFRLGALLTFGGIYVDADSEPDVPLCDLLARVPHSAFFTFFGQINNALMLFREAEDAFLRACFMLSLDNIQTRRFDECFLAAGPGVLNAVRSIAEPGSRPELESMFAGRWMDKGFGELLDTAERLIVPSAELTAAYRRITQLPVAEAERWARVTEPAYKQTDRHWLNWTRNAYR